MDDLSQRLDTAKSFFEALYGADSLGVLSLFALPAKESRFIPVAHPTWTNAASAWAIAQSGSQNVYFAPGLQGSIPGPGQRGDARGVVVMPAVWADIDVRGPNHTRTDLPPTLADAQLIMESIPLRPTIVVYSGGGLQAYWVFTAPLIITTDDERASAQRLITRFQGQLRDAANLHGWGLDNTADLCRLLRVPGTWNHKQTEPQPVRYEIPDSGRRYAPEEVSAILSVEPSRWQVDNGRKSQVKPQLEAIFAGCPWLRHCRDDAATLSEPEWYRLLSIVGRCENGQQLAHELSQDYPGYSAEETEEKLQRALAASGPATCTYIATQLGARNTFCAQCEHRGRISTPLILGTQRAAHFVSASEDLQHWPDPPVTGPYRAADRGIVLVKTEKGGGETEVLLANFHAQITAELVFDDGEEQERGFEITAKLAGREQTCRVSASEFNNMTWVLEKLGARAIVSAGVGTRDHLRTAIQRLSPADLPERPVFQHTGWRQLSGGWMFLHAGGAIGAEGAVDDVQVDLPIAVRGFQLPTPPTGQALVEAIRADLGLLRVAAASITIPLLATVYRAALGNADFSLFVTGKTGVGKSELAALAQQHFGPGLDARHFPANFSSTVNANEAIAFAAKDCVLVVDDFCPTGSAADVQRYHSNADRLCRNQGNRAGRQRLGVRDGELRPPKYPRGLMMGTGEDVPQGHSLRARMLILDIAPDSIDWAVLSKIQSEAREGVYAGVISAFLAWLAP